MKRIGIFGSGGSIGTQALDFIKANSEHFKADVLVTYSNSDLLIEQAKQFKPWAIGIIDQAAYDKDKFTCLDSVKVAVGSEALELCKYVDQVLFCAVGADMLSALMSYVSCGKQIALANKECLVSAGELIMNQAKISGSQIIPVDSEHSAVWQCLRAGDKGEVSKIILTASGGRYYRYSYDELKNITPSEAVRHPNWKMGKKISVDSATMMNKALEILEARWLFDSTKIDYVIHPESIIHSMVQFTDGAIFAQMSQPDMRLPISVALSYPQRQISGIKNYSFDRPLTFLPKREEVFFAPVLAEYCIKKGGTSGIIMDASNEGAVKLFMQGKIPFTKITEIVKEELYSAQITYNPSVSDVIELHDEIKNKILRKYNS